MKPFNLELAKQGKPVCTGDGRKARIICFNRNSLYNFPIVALIEYGHYEEKPVTYTNNGKSSGCEPDLMMANEKHECWINIFKGADGIYFTHRTYNTKKEAEEAGRNIKSYITTTKVEWEE